MFRRLAEAFQNDNNHPQFANQQNKYFNVLPNMILSGSSGLKGFDTATQSVDTIGQNYQKPAVKFPNDIFIQDNSPNLNQMAQACASGTIDNLIAAKNPNAGVGCGWLYTPPNQGSPYPNLSQGFIGDTDGPLQNFSPPNYKKWFFDLQLAKKQILLDKCKALKACTDVDSEVFQGSCGYCTDTNQGVPIDSVGQPLYGGDPLGTCSPQSILTSGGNCPPPPGSVPGGGPQPMIDRTCQPVNGRLPASCLYDKLLTAGCSDNGSLAIALGNPTSPNDYIGSLRDGDAVKVYNRVANPPLNLDIFTNGAATVTQVLQEARQLVGNTQAAANTGLGASARDLCLQTGAINNYDFCNDLSDSTTAPFDIVCLQKIFKKMGGQPTGLSYPQAGNITKYNSMGTLGAAKQYMSNLAANMQSNDYDTQRSAMIQFLGIQPELLIKRAPYTAGVEVIWFLIKPGSPNVIYGVLKRTIENDIVQFGPTGDSIPQLASTYPGFNQYAGMIQMFDVRSPTNFSTQFSVYIDDGFFVAVNQPANIASSIFNTMTADQPGLFGYLGINPPTMFTSTACSNYYGNTPNITKIFYEDAGGGGHTLNFNVNLCTSGEVKYSPPYFSLTCEPRAPFLNFEVLPDGGTYDDTRNPGLISNLLWVQSLDYHNRPEERNSVPGKKGFVRFTNSTTYINHMNIAYQAWGTVTFAFRLQSMPVDDAIFSFWVNTYNCRIYLQPLNGSTAQLKVNTNMTRDGSTYDANMALPSIKVGQWYLMSAAQTSNGLDINCDSINNILQNGNFTSGVDSIFSNGPITTTQNYGLYSQGQYDCSVRVGGIAASMNKANSAFVFDLAWTHFFDYYITAADVLKEAKAAWIFTQFPDSPGAYKTLG